MDDKEREEREKILASLPDGWVKVLPEGCYDDRTSNHLRYSERLKAKLKELGGEYVDSKTRQVYKALVPRMILERNAYAVIATLEEPISPFLPTWAIEEWKYVDCGNGPADYTFSSFWGFRSEVEEYRKKLFEEPIV